MFILVIKYVFKHSVRPNLHLNPSYDRLYNGPKCCSQIL